MSAKKAKFILFLYLVLPSLHQVQKHLGSVGVAAFCPAMFLLVHLVSGCRSLRKISHLTHRQVLGSGIILSLVFVFLFLLVHPRLPHGMNQGSDNEDALNVAVRALLHGRFPYYSKTYLGNWIDHLPGTILLAAPFVLLFGTSGFQNLFWMPLFFFVSSRCLRNSGLALVMLLFIMLSPEILQNWIVGRDLPTNNASVLISTLLLLHSVCSVTSRRWQKVGASLFFGICLSSRLYFVLLVPLVFSFISQHAGWKQAVKSLALAGLAFTAITFPFYFYDPSGFSPFRMQNELKNFADLFPYIDVIVVAGCGLIAVALSCRRMDKDGAAFLRSCAAVLIFPLICAVVVSSLAYRRPDFEYLTYATASLFFIAPAAWKEFETTCTEGPLSSQRS